MRFSTKTQNRVMLVRVEVSGGLELAKLAVGQRYTQEEEGLEGSRGAEERSGLFTPTPDA